MEVKLQTVNEARDFLDQIISSFEGKNINNQEVDDLKWLSNQLYLLV